MPEAAAPQPSSSKQPKNPFAPNLGWVSVEEIHNVFVTALRELDVILRDTQYSTEAVRKHVETIKYQLAQRSKRNYQEYLKFHPEQAIPSQVADSRDAYQKRIDSLRRG